MNDQSIVDKTMRSVFGKLYYRILYPYLRIGISILKFMFTFSVGNIPYEVSEEKLKDIFSEVGPVLSFK